MKQKLIDGIQALIDELVKNRKQKAADFFLKEKANIDSECGGSREELLNILDQLQRSGSMIQYANFTQKEESLWEVVHDLAKKWRSAMS